MPTTRLAPPTRANLARWLAEHYHPDAALTSDGPRKGAVASDGQVLAANCATWRDVADALGALNADGMLELVERRGGGRGHSPELVLHVNLSPAAAEVVRQWVKAAGQRYNRASASALVEQMVKLLDSADVQAALPALAALKRALEERDPAAARGVMQVMAAVVAAE